jgi:uncharacterized membrane protein (UPF0127 family)
MVYMKRSRPFASIKSFPGDNIYLHAKVTANGFVVMADIAVTDEQRAKGLDIKNSFIENKRILFVFDKSVCGVGK